MRHPRLSEDLTSDNTSYEKGECKFEKSTLVKIKRFNKSTEKKYGVQDHLFGGVFAFFVYNAGKCGRIYLFYRFYDKAV